MSDTNKTIQLADALRSMLVDTSLSDRYCEVLSQADDELRRIVAQRDRLLNVLKDVMDELVDRHETNEVAVVARAIIKAVEE